MNTLDPNTGTDYCLTCAGTGRKGGNLGSRKKKVCPTCQGTGTRTVLIEPTNTTVVDDFTPKLPK